MSVNTAVFTAEGQRLLSRRMTRLFPLGLAAAMIVGVIIAMLTVGDEGVHFVDDIASGVYGGIPGDNSTQVLGPLGFLVPIMAFVIGASFFGADQKTGMIEQLLTWEPRRSRLLLGRITSGAAAIFVVAAALSAFVVMMLYILSRATGSTDGAFDIWPTVLGAIVRSGLTGAIFFALGFGLTVLVNSSVASIVGFLIYVFVIETALVQPLLPKWSVWLPMTNADAFVSRNGVGQGGFFEGVEILNNQLPNFHHGWIAAGLLLAAWAAVACGAAVMVFNRRDID